jgi:hypothetical protein
MISDLFSDTCLRDSFTTSTLDLRQETLLALVAFPSLEYYLNSRRKVSVGEDVGQAEVGRVHLRELVQVDRLGLWNRLQQYLFRS